MAKGAVGFELPFGIDFVVKHNHLVQENSKIKKKVREDYDIDCPFCNGIKKLNVNSIKGMWRCNKCNEAGNAITLHAKINEIDNKTAYRDLKNLAKGLPSTYHSAQKEDTKKFPDVAPLFLRNTAYRSLIDRLNLSSSHTEKLHDRGLTDEQIEKFEYRSFPLVGIHSLAKQIIFDSGLSTGLKNINAQIPGFYDYGEDVKLVKRKSSILIPIRHYTGEISGFQLRFDTGEKRYSWLSSSEKETGATCSGIQNIHFSGFDYDALRDGEAVVETVNVTEGALKADVCSALSGKPFIGILGVNNQSQVPGILDFLKSRGCEMINICFDMDYREKKEVKKALDDFKKKVKDARLEYKMFEWPAEYKGLDDFLLARKMSRE